MTHRCPRARGKCHSAPTCRIPAQRLRTDLRHGSCARSSVGRAVSRSPPTAIACPLSPVIGTSASRSRPSRPRRTAPSSLPRPVLQIPHNGRSDPLGRPTRIHPGFFFFKTQAHRGRYRVVIGQPHHHDTPGSVFTVLVSHRGKTIDRTHLTEDRTPWLGIGIRRTQALPGNSVETDFEPTEGLPVAPVTARPKTIQVSALALCRSFAQRFLDLLWREHFTRITGQC